MFILMLLSMQSMPIISSDKGLAVLPLKPFSSGVLIASAASIWGVSSLADIWFDKKSKDLFSFTSTSATSDGLTTKTTFSFLPSLGMKQEQQDADGVIEQKCKLGFFVYDDKVPAPLYKKIGYSFIPMIVLSYALLYLKEHVSPHILASLKK